MTSAAPPRVHVGIDARCLNTDHVRGMGKYVAEVLQHTGGAEDLAWSLFGDRPDTALHRPAGTQVRTEVFDFKGYRFHTWEQLGLPWRARRARVDVLHCTATTLPIWQPMPTIVTLHDTLLWQAGREDGNGSAGHSWYLDRLIPAAFGRCRAIITISEASRRDIVATWPWLEPKLHVIPHGVGDAYLQAGDEPVSEPLRAHLGTGPYLLYVGGAVERKRFAWAVRVFESLSAPDLQLAVCGFARAETARAREQVASQLRERVRFLPFVDETQMPALYRHAVAVLYPTLYEGFGFPAVEAQAVGTPVLFSALGSLAELQGPAAEILPAEDLSAWQQTLRRLLQERAPSPLPNQAARAWARRFSWNVSAGRHFNLYREAAGVCPVGVRTSA